MKWTLGALCLVVALSRWYALSTSQLDWDESLFAGGVRSYDVIAQHPHPPGYPLFIFFAKIVHVVVRDDFRSLQVVVAIASFLLFPATYFLLRELGLRLAAAISGALITVFLPTVWYYGGTALSDVPALTAAIAASALFLAGRRDPRLWIAGALAAGIAGGIRPLHVLIALPCGAAAVPGRRRFVLGIAAFVAVIAISYTGAALATPNPPWGYLQQIGITTHHIETVDSYNNTTRPPLPKLASMFFLDAQRGGRAGIAILILAAIGIAGRPKTMALVAAMFVPIAILSWMMLDITAVTRYALAYVMFFSIGAACGIDVLSRSHDSIVAVATAALVVAMILWTRPALRIVRHQASPPVAAMQWIRAHVPPKGPSIYLEDSLGYHAGHELIDYDNHFFNTYDQIPAGAYAAGNYCLVDHLTIQPHALYWSFPRKRLAQIAREVYFETSVIPMATMIRFGDGWYQDEYDGPREHAWKWMKQKSATLLPPLAGKGVLRLQFHLPLNALPHPPKVTVLWNGQAIDDAICKESENDRQYVLDSRSESPNECVILTDEAASANGDPREFGLQLTGISWDETTRRTDRAFRASDRNRADAAVTYEESAESGGVGDGVVAEVLRRRRDDRNAGGILAHQHRHHSPPDSRLAHDPRRPDRVGAVGVAR